jgi:methionine aminotransferase
MKFEGTIKSKFPTMGTTIFTVMTALAKEFNAINLSQGFPEFDPHPKLLEAFENAIRSGNNQYAPMAGWMPLREALAEKINDFYQLDINPETEITITAGGTQAIFTAITSLLKEGDEVVVFGPAYDCYVPSIELVGAKPVFYNLEAPDFAIDWSKVAKLISQKTKMIILNTPHNPTGRVLKQEDFKKLEKLVHGSDIIILSDEVYEHIVYDKQKHLSILQQEGLVGRSIAVFSFGKTYNTTGWKVGYVVAPEALTTEFRKVHQYTVFSVSTPAQIAYTEILKEKEIYLELSDFYEQKRDFFRNAIGASKLELLPCEGTYFQLATYDKISDQNDVDFAKWLTREKGVAAIPISVFYNKKVETKAIRFCFAKEEKTLNKAAEWLSKV